MTAPKAIANPNPSLSPARRVPVAAATSTRIPDCIRPWLAAAAPLPVLSPLVYAQNPRTQMLSSSFFIITALLLCTVLVQAADLYKVLDRACCESALHIHLISRLVVHKSASEQDFRKAYKRLSRKYHPDKNKEPDAEERFVEVAHGECVTQSAGTRAADLPAQHTRCFPIPQ